MPTVQIMSVIGSAVPAPCVSWGLLACWYLVRDGETISGPLTSLPPPKSKRSLKVQAPA
jgi:hypothetical protein